MQKITAQSEQTIHGALNYAELEQLGFSAEEILDFSVNVNPYGPSPRAREAMLQATIERYPDRACLQLRRTILEYELANRALALNTLVCGNGTAELIWAIARAELQPGRKTAILGPTFGEYRAASQAVGAEVVEFCPAANQNFQPDVAGVASWVRQQKPALVWLCNPNNPTGIWLGYADLSQIAQACQDVRATLVIDEAYWHFVSPHETFSAFDLLKEEMPIIVLRSLTKDFALAGLRLGYAVARAENVIQRLRAQLPPWNVSEVAQKVGVAALRDRVHLTTTLAQLAEESAAFSQAMQGANLRALPTRTHFFLLDVGDAALVRRRLLAKRLLVRDCTSFGLPHSIRVATRPQEDWQRLLSALQEVL